MHNWLSGSGMGKSPCFVGVLSSGLCTELCAILLVILFFWFALEVSVLAWFGFWVVRCLWLLSFCKSGALKICERFFNSWLLVRSNLTDHFFVFSWRRIIFIKPSLFFYSFAIAWHILRQWGVENVGPTVCWEILRKLFGSCRWMERPITKAVLGRIQTLILVSTIFCLFA